MELQAPQSYCVLRGLVPSSSLGMLSVQKGTPGTAGLNYHSRQACPMVGAWWARAFQMGVFFGLMGPQFTGPPSVSNGFWQEMLKVERRMQVEDVVNVCMQC